MPPKVVHLQESAFTSLLLASAEAFSHRYRLEMFSILLGVISDSEVWVEAAQTLSTADASNREVWVEDRTWDAVQRILSELSGQMVVGECHTHPQTWKSDSEGRKPRANPNPSSFDLRLWRSVEKERKGQVFMIISVNEGRGPVGFRYVKNGYELSGRLSNFDFRFRAYGFGSNRLSRVKIICPFALGLKK